MDNNSESLLQEHHRRFFVLPQQEKYMTKGIEEALRLNDQLLWSLGIIPWRIWRYPFQKAMIAYLIELNLEKADNIYDIVNTALATAHADYYSLPSEADRDALLNTINAFCSDVVSNHIAEQIHKIKPQKPFLNNSTLEKLLLFLLKNRKAQKNKEDIQYNFTLLHFRIIDAFLKRCNSILPTSEGATPIDIIAMGTFITLTNTNLEAPEYYTKNSYQADPSSSTPEIFNFFSWQYTYRNEEFQILRQPLDVFLGHGDALDYNITISNAKEYQSAYPRIISKGNSSNMLCEDYDLAISTIYEKFDYYPAWPIKDYTSDFILARILSGEFKYWERDTPPPKVSQESKFHCCGHNISSCTNENRITKMVTDGIKTWETCAPECLVAMQNQGETAYHKVLNEERPRIRKEGLHRMIGLWLWDYCNEHGVRATEAIRALKARHFPEKNPSWDVSKISEIKNTPKNADWYDYREKTTEEAILRADLRDARNCIEAAKFLLLSRGIKKPSKPLNNKGKNKK